MAFFVILRLAMLRSIAAAAVAFAPALAYADEPPMRPRWDAHINDQPVVVGHHKPDAESEVKHVNLATNPVGFLCGFYGLSASFAVTRNVTVRINGERLDYELFGRVDGGEGSLSAPIYLAHAFSGPFIEPGVYHREATETDWELDGVEMTHARTSTGALVLFGWHHMFKSGFNIAGALGARRAISATTDGQMPETIEPEVTGYLRVGYAF